MVVRYGQKTIRYKAVPSCLSCLANTGLGLRDFRKACRQATGSGGAGNYRGAAGTRAFTQTGSRGGAGRSEGTEGSPGNVAACAATDGTGRLRRLAARKPEGTQAGQESSAGGRSLVQHGISLCPPAESQERQPAGDKFF